MGALTIRLRPLFCCAALPTHFAFPAGSFDAAAKSSLRRSNIPFRLDLDRAVMTTSFAFIAGLTPLTIVAEAAC